MLLGLLVTNINCGIRAGDGGGGDDPCKTTPCQIGFVAGGVLGRMIGGTFED